jgi:hypothetical protein
MVIPIMAACLLARAAASLFCPTPVYRDFAERMVQDYERRHATRHPAGESDDDADDHSPPPVGRTSAFGEPAAPGENAARRQP